MFKAVTTVADLLSDSKILRPLNLDFCRNTPLIEIGGSEINECVREFPLCFTYTDNSWRLCVLMSAEVGSNYYVSPSSGWTAQYIPSQIRAWPFGYSEDLEHLEVDRDAIFDPSSDEEKFTDLYEDRNRLSSVAIDKALGILGEFKKTRDTTRHLSHLLNSYGLLKPLRLVVQKESKTTNFEGLYQIDEDRLYDLDDQTLQILHKKRALSIAYCQVISRINFGKIQERVADLLKMEKQQSEIQSEIGSFVSDNEKFGF